ncbi:MAG: DUF1275 domain-containing protein [Oscillospiraceae bacterium]|nr:DUF1275 domain-containing protein [Oscillospiraceae bacterium]
MLTADSADRVATFKVAFMTGASIFVMGYMNGLSLNTNDLGVMMTPQTGNIIWLGLNAASGYWQYFFENLGLMFGFMGGAVFALFTQSLFANKKSQFFFNWSIFAIPMVLYPLVMQYVVYPLISFMIIGFASGAALGFFRKMYHMEINNAMATGNVRFLGLHFAGAFIKKNKKEVTTFWIFFACVFLFAAGAFLYAILAQMDNNLGLEGAGRIIGLGDHSNQIPRQTLGLGEYRIDIVSSNIARFIGLIVICVIPYFFFPKSVSAEQK